MSSSIKQIISISLMYTAIVAPIYISYKNLDKKIDELSKVKQHRYDACERKLDNFTGGGNNMESN
jgi:hypothetical protein